MPENASSSSKSPGEALHEAAAHLDWPTVSALVRAGCSLDVRDGQGWTPLYAACRFDRLDGVKQLIALGANVEAASDSGHTPLMVTATTENVAAMQLLLKAGASIKTATPANGYTALHLALLHIPGKVEHVETIVRLLVNAGADINARSREGLTPLMNAASFGSTRLVSLLLELGANPNLTDGKGKTAADLATERGFAALAGSLESAMRASARTPKGLLSRLTRWLTGGG